MKIYGIILSVLGAASVALSTSCHGELDVTQSDKLNTTNMWTSESDALTATTGIYYRLRQAFARFMAALRYEPCTQFINVSQRTLHIYFIDGCRRIKIERNNLLCEQAPTEVFRSIFA